MVVESKGWNWKVVKGAQVDFWRTPSAESYYLMHRWHDQGKVDFLDLGCGIGRHAVLFGKNGFKVSCFDISEEALKQTREWAEKENLSFDYKLGDMLELPYKDDSFDCILCRNVISHSDTDGVRQIIRELKRVLRSGGECYVTFGSKDTWGWKQEHWPLIDENTRRRVEDGPENGVPHFCVDYNLCEELFKDFEIMDIHQEVEYIKRGSEVMESYHYRVLVKKASD